jgi:ABC-type antimicrobial peptide transport system permease subunit
MFLVVSLCAPIMCLGVHGAAAHEVEMQKRDAAIRLALGAAPSAIGKRLQARMACVGFLGVALGLPFGFAVGRFFESQVFGVSAVDPLAVGTVALATIVVVWLGSVASSRRLQRVDPSTLLRES